MGRLTATHKLESFSNSLMVFTGIKTSLITIFIMKMSICKPAFNMLFSKSFLLSACNRFWWCYHIFSWHCDIRSQGILKILQIWRFWRYYCTIIHVQIYYLVFLFLVINTKGNFTFQWCECLPNSSLQQRKTRKHLYAPLKNMYVLYFKDHNICKFGENAFEISYSYQVEIHDLRIHLKDKIQRSCWMMPCPKKT